MLLKFGIEDVHPDAAHEVREGLIERDEAVALVKRFDTEFPQKSLPVFLSYCQMTIDDFKRIEEKWRIFPLGK